MQRLNNLVLAPLALVLAACASNPEVAQGPALQEALADSDYQLGAQRPALEHRDAQAYSVIDTRHLLIEDEGGNAHVVALQHDCRQLRAAMALTFEKNGEHLAPHDKIVVTGDGGLPETCEVASIHEVTKL